MNSSLNVIWTYKVLINRIIKQFYSCKTTFHWLYYVLILNICIKSYKINRWKILKNYKRFVAVDITNQHTYTCFFSRNDYKWQFNETLTDISLLRIFKIRIYYNGANETISFPVLCSAISSQHGSEVSYQLHLILLHIYVLV